MSSNQKANPRSPRAFLREIKKNIDFSFWGTRAQITSIIVMGVMVIFLIWHSDLFLGLTEFPKGPVVFAFSILAVPLTGFLMNTRIKLSGWLSVLANTLAFFLLPIATMQMVECFNGKFVYDYSVPTFWLNYALYLFLYVLFYLITGRIHMTGLIVNIAMYVFGMLNYFVEVFRTIPFLPVDLLNIRDGMNVANGYKPEMSWNLITASICMLLIYLVNKKTKNIRPQKLRFKVLTKLLAAGWLFIVVGTLFGTDFLAGEGYKPDFFNQSRGYHKTGVWLNFCLNLKYLLVSAPEDYDAAEVEGILNSMLEKYGVDPEGDVSLNLLTGENNYTATAGSTPNMIMIMNESWADLETLGDLEVSEDLFPFVDSLKENTVKGTVQIPVFGTGTSNSEYEFLSGDSIAFLPAGCNIYQSYIKDEVPTLVSELKSLNYAITAYHPYYESSWNRPKVYDLFGFDDFISIEDFIDKDILDRYIETNNAETYIYQLKKRYPDKDILMRRFVSDAYDFQMIEEMYENRDPDRNFAVFNVTMQNHGGYAVHYSNFDETVEATNLSKHYEHAERYLSLIKETDKAFEDLVAYFEQVEEPTIIVMFGDHQPSIETAFYQEVYGTSLDLLTDEQAQARYTTPFVIWANYDIPEAEVERISANYLSTLLCQLAGLEQTPYQKYLACLYQELPVLDSYGYITADGDYCSYSDTTDQTELIRQYQCLEYNHLIDRDHRVTKLFTLPGAAAKESSSGKEDGASDG